jgi:hypothetical protein
MRDRAPGANNYWTIIFIENDPKKASDVSVAAMNLSKQGDVCQKW